MYALLAVLSYEEERPEVMTPTAVQPTMTATETSPSKGQESGVESDNRQARTGARITARKTRTQTGIETVYRVNGICFETLEEVQSFLEVA